MALIYEYDGGAIAHNIAPSGISLTHRADMGEASFGGIPIEDPAGTLALVGHKTFTVEEDDCAQPRLFTGWTTERGIGRDLDRGMFVGPNPRLHDTTIVDINAAFGFRQITGEDGNRPEETWQARCTWILQSDYLDDAISHSEAFIVTNTTLMDAADYRGSAPAAVMDSLSDRSGNAYTYFLFYRPSNGLITLFFDNPTSFIAASTLSISNVYTDVDNATCFAPDSVAKLAREPDQTYSEVTVEYGNGQKVFRTLASTATQFIRRGTSISRPYTKRESTAISQADKWLQKHAFEVDRITCSIQVPSSAAGLVQAGQSMDVKFTHMPGYEDFTTLRVVSCSPKPTNDVADFYDIALELVGWTPAEEVVTSQIGLAFTDSGCGPGTFPDSPRIPLYAALGDAPPAGYLPYPTIGLFVGVPCGGGGWYGVQCLGSGTVSILHRCAYAGVSSLGDTITWAIRLNGGEIATGSWSDPEEGWGHFNSEDVELQIDDVAVVAGDIIDTYVTVSGWNPYYRRVGGSSSWNPGLKVWGDLTFEAATGDPIPQPVHPTTTVSDAPPTADDDETLGFQVGDHWIDTDTGTEYVLVDNTDGASVWVTVTNETLEAAIEYVVDGGGAELTTGLKGFLEIPFACAITAARMLADQSGDAVVDVWAEGYADFPPTNADSITAAAPLTVASGVKSEDVTLTGWTKTIAAGDILGFNIDSVSTITRLTISLTVMRA